MNPNSFSSNLVPASGKMSGRRRFFRAFTKGILSIAGVSATVAKAKGRGTSYDWLDDIKGSHRILYDVTTGQDEFVVALPFNFMLTNNQTGTADDDLTVVVVLRHKAMALALNDKAWGKYKLGKFFKISDVGTAIPATKNPYWNPTADELPQGMSFQALKQRGVIVCVCELALTKNSKMLSASMGMDHTEVRNDWMNSLLPGAHLVPSGVWAIERAQQKACAYCFVG